MLSKLLQCCGVSLRKCVLAIGFTYIVTNIPLLYLYGFPIILHKLYGGELEEPTLFADYIISILLGAHLISCVILIMATIKRSPNWFWPWKWVSLALFSLTFFLSMLCCYLYIYQVRKGDIEDDPKEAVTYLLIFIYAVILFASVSVVNSYKAELQADNGSEQDLDLEVEMAPLNIV